MARPYPSRNSCCACRGSRAGGFLGWLDASRKRHVGAAAIGKAQNDRALIENELGKLYGAVTKLIRRKDPEWNSPQGQAARQKEVTNHAKKGTWRPKAIEWSDAKRHIIVPLYGVMVVPLSHCPMVPYHIMIS